jgi:hypothetical protein
MENEDYFTPLASQIIGGVITIVVVYASAKIIEKTVLKRYIERTRRKMEELDVKESLAQ